jgi:hypothetical protein
MLNKLVLEPLAEAAQATGAGAQAAFDRKVLGMEAPALHIDVPPVEIAHEVGSRADLRRYESWYAVDATAPWPSSVAECFRQNAIWALRQHRAYADLLALILSAFAVAGLAFALLVDASLRDYLAFVVLPCLPPMSDLGVLIRRHRRTADARRAVDAQLQRLPQDVTGAEAGLRAAANQLSLLRQAGPMVPDWFYRTIRNQYERDMRFAAESRRASAE